MKRLAIFISAIFAIALIGNVEPQSSFANTPDNVHQVIVKADSSQTLTGTVVDATTGKAVSGATVQLEGSDNSATTDSSGNFELDDVSSGDYNIMVTADGYKDFEGKITVSGKVRPFSIKLTPKMSQ